MPAIYLHIGLPKTGTTYLQDVLYRNRNRLAEAGVLYPAPYPEAHFDAAIDLRDMAFGGLVDPQVSGRWDRLGKASVEWAGRSVVISHELLAGADADAIAQVAATFRGHHVRIVITARDLGRQVPAMWQEYVKNHSTVTFESFAERLTRDPRRTKAARIFWRQQDLAAVVERWSGALPVAAVHLVTVPPSGAPSEQLWERFAAATRLPGDGLDLHSDARNPSLPFAGTELLRRVNRSLGDTLEWPAYEATVKAWFAETLAGLVSGQAPAVPSRLRPWFEERSRATIDELAARPLRVEGGLDDLLPQWPTDEAPSAPDQEAVLDAAAAALATLLTDRAGLHGRGPLVERFRRNSVLRRLPQPVQEWLKRRASS